MAQRKGLGLWQHLGTQVTGLAGSRGIAEATPTAPRDPRIRAKSATRDPRHRATLAALSWLS